MRNWVGLAVVTSLLMPALVYAEKKALSPSDYEEIRGLYAKYSYGFDTGDAQLVASVYTPDGQFIVGGKLAGDSREKIAKMVRPPAPGGPGMKHVPSNILIEASDGGASGMAYVTLVSYQDGKMPVVTGGGVYRDMLVKTAEGWRFKKRDYSPFSAPPAAPATP